MPRITLVAKTRADEAAAGLAADMTRRLAATPQGNCPLEATAAYLRTCVSQSCGKCTPCRVGLVKLADLIDKMLEGEATEQDVATFAATADVVYKTADCAIGYEAGRLAKASVAAFKGEYLNHAAGKACNAKLAPVPCVGGCPASVDVAAYVALVKAGRLEDAIRVIRNDNPFPSVCGYVCEHPCESVCRRGIIDAPVNIRGVKKYAVDNTADVPTPQPLPATGKKVAVVGGGPSGLTCAYYLRLMGHAVTVFEASDHLGGMTWYGIPRYRLPEEKLAYDVDAILSTGVEVKLNSPVGGEDLPFAQLAETYDQIYIAIGAHAAKGLGIPGQDKAGVYSAVEILRQTSGLTGTVDMAGKDVVVIGGGNVAMDVTRTAKRLGAASVRTVYRRRVEDMTALPAEVASAIAEGCEMVPLMAPVEVTDGTVKPLALVVQPQIPGPYASGRPKPVKAEKPAEVIECDIIVAAIGQDIQSENFAQAGFEVDRKRFVFSGDCRAQGIGAAAAAFVGGDGATGPATVIRAIAAGKVAAANIDAALGYNHNVRDNVEIPYASFFSTEPCGRINIEEFPAAERVAGFSAVEAPLTPQEIKQECGRCLRCDSFGLGAMREGRPQW